MVGRWGFEGVGWGWGMEEEMRWGDERHFEQYGR